MTEPTEPTEPLLTGAHPFPVCVCLQCGPPWRKGDDWKSSASARLGFASWMALCPTCGSKRCPGAIDHRQHPADAEPQNTPVSTPSGPSAGLEGQDATQETQDATEAAQRRVERYAEEFWRALRIAEGEAAARVAIAVADQEQAEKDATIAELRAEVERLRKPTVAAVMGYELGAGDLEHAEARVAELEAIVAKVREVHQPYQLFEPCPKTWGCEHDDCCEDPADGEYYHSDKPVSRACVECRDEDGQPVDWPCETAAILDAPKDTTAP